MMTALLLAVPLPSAAAQEPASPPANALILFGANWCAPCLEELRSLHLWGAVVAPAQVLLAWTDGSPPRLWSQWPGNARLLPPGEARPLLVRIGGRTAGLPYVAMLDAKGKLCADLRGKLSAERLSAMRQKCGAS